MKLKMVHLKYFKIYSRGLQTGYLNYFMRMQQDHLEENLIHF